MTRVAAAAVLLICEIVSVYAEPCVLKNSANKGTNLREAPDSSKIIKTLANGELVDITTTVTGKNKVVWANIATSKDGLKGWMYRSKLDCARKEITSDETTNSIPPPTSSEIKLNKLRNINGALRCELVGQCTAARPGTQDNDKSCPYGFGVSDGLYKIVINHTENRAVVTEPNNDNIEFPMTCDGDGCNGFNTDLTENIHWSRQFKIDNKKLIFSYIYSFGFESDSYMPLILTHTYQGKCVRSGSLR